MARSAADNGEVNHLRGEDKRRHNAHQRHHPVFEHAGGYLYCDSAWLDEVTNIVDCYGSVHIKSSDTLNLYGKMLHYDGNTRIALLSNAVRFNIDGGFIKCHIDKMFLIITNAGLPLTINPEDLFKRFHKSSNNPQSVGLGLSIVKKIAETYGMHIIYTCHDAAYRQALLFGPL